MQWEYMIYPVPYRGTPLMGLDNSMVIEMLNQFGWMGWELVTSYTWVNPEPSSATEEMFGQPEETGGFLEIVLLFKRPLLGEG